MKKELYAKLDLLQKTAKRGLITLPECNKLMFDAIENAFDIEYFDTKQKYYHRMYKLLFDLTKNH